MNDPERFEDAIKRIDDANREDPRTEVVDGRDEPRELLFSQRVFDWVERLIDDPSEAVLLAARAHTMRRWVIPRDRYPKTTEGYHRWRSALADFHADEAEKVLLGVGYEGETVELVRAFITKKNWPANKEARALEDADCLVFLQTKLSSYLDDWDEDKMDRVLRGTVGKMTPRARTLALQLELPPRERSLLQRAAG